ncbi:unnamed protein product, partial [Iphiclides podalirius]
MLLLFFLMSSAVALVVHEPPPPQPRTRTVPVEGWSSIRLHQFDASNTDTFQMRYYYNSEFAATNNVVIFVGGEWAISPGWVAGGLAHELAEALEAGLFYTEHRYYGQTRPTNDTRSTELRFLTVDQALADLAQFIQYIRSDRFDGGRFSGGKVSLVGCSYAGSMATWMRLGYPHLVTAAFSDSGPLLAQEDFPEYLEVITDALLSQGSEECVASVAEAIEKAVKMLADERSAQVSEMFNTCSPINGSNPLDVSTFFWFGITETFAYLVQYATPGDIPAACDVITDIRESDPLRRLATWVRSQPWTQPCIESRYERQVAYHTNTSYDSVMRLWTYQTCVEFGWYQTTSSDRQPFLSTVPLEYFHRMCKDFFGDYFDEGVLRRGIERSNLLWGGRRHQPDGVIAVAGGLDPWMPMGPLPEHGTPLAPVHLVPGVSHCRAIRSTGDSETEELERAKRAVLRGMQDLVEGRPPYSGSTKTTTMTIVVITALLTLIVVD